MHYTFNFLENEYFWGGSAVDGKINPLKASSDFTADYREECINQTMPLFLSSIGRYIWSDNPFKIEIKDGIINIDGENVELYEAGTSLKDAYLGAMKRHFPTDKRKLPMEYFSAPQFNTWMEFVYEPTQDKVLSYAEAVIENGFTPGIFIIDEGWQIQYGKWEFDKLKFPNPKKMIEKLHDMGFKVILWVCPWVRADGYDFIKYTEPLLPVPYKDAKEILLRDKDNEFAMMKWWNGISAMLDLRKSCDREFMDNQLKKLMDDYGIDGFKFDGGNICEGGYHTKNLLNGEPHENHNAHDLNIAWNEFGRKYEYHEFKDTYKGGGKNSIQRLCDCDHKWVGGADVLVPDTILQGLLGHPFVCPDMVAGGAWFYSADPNFIVDEEMFIRMAQASCLCPMLQFSWAPWMALSKEALNIIKDAMKLREKLMPYIKELVECSFETCEPIIRSLEYEFPHQGFETCMDTFMLGDRYLVKPITVKGVNFTKIKLPKGRWKYRDGTIYGGGKEIKIDCPISVIPYFEKI